MSATTKKPEDTKPQTVQAAQPTVKLLQRSTTNKMIAGVCGGLAVYFNLDPVLMRVIFVALALAGGPGVVLYIILWVVMPEDTAPVAVTPTTAK
jgi:phage shock protein C